MSNPSISQKEFGIKIGKSARTLQRWDEKNLFKARRTPAGEPFYLPEDVERYFQLSKEEKKTLQGDHNGNK